MKSKMYFHHGMSFGTGINIIHVVAIIRILVTTTAQITIDMDGKLIIWEGCIFRRTSIVKDNNDPCYKCSESTNRPTILKSLTDWPQPYFNCTEECPRRTICTVKKYYNGEDNMPRSLCYNCENLKTEEIIFEFVRDEELCNTNCSACASNHDLAQATICAKDCEGRPTFCSPLRRWFGKSIKCFKATFWYGCDYVEVSKSSLSKECLDCALNATNNIEAQECAHDCNGIPMCHLHPNGENDTNTIIVQCRPHIIGADKNGVGTYFMEDLFLYDLPNHILPFMRFNIPTSIYPAEYLAREAIPGPVAKNIWRKFSMADTTYPKPKAYKYK